MNKYIMSTTSVLHSKYR